MAAADRAIKDFLFPRMYRHPRMMRIMGDAEGVVRDLFARYRTSPPNCPGAWRPAAIRPAPRAAQIADFIAGMTDRYALDRAFAAF